MKKSTILKKLEAHEEKIEKALLDFKDFIDSVEDEELSIMGEDFYEIIVDYIYENDTINLSNIRDFIENVYENE